MGPLWEVVGGAKQGGIIIRQGQDVKSQQCNDRLSTGSIVEELMLIGERLHFKVIPGTGTGPEEGWASLKAQGISLLAMKDPDPQEVAQSPWPSEEGGAVEVDEDLRAKIEGMAKEKAGDFAKYVPKYKVFKFPLEAPKFRVFCFHNSGSAESQYSQKASNPLVDWVQENGQVEFLSLQYPGRENMRKEPMHHTFDTLAPLLLSIIYEKIADGVPYCIWGHSVGTWLCFELITLMRKIGLPSPKAAFLSAFPGPHLPLAWRPWRRSRRLSTEEMKDEVMNWDKEHFTGQGSIAFKDPEWAELWEPMMRGDFQMFDEYQLKHNGAPKFDFPFHCWHMSNEHYNSADMIKMWGDWTTARFDFRIMEGMGHLTCFYNPDYRKEFFSQVVAELQTYFQEATA